MIATVHLHVLHRTLDPLGIVLALALATVIVLVGVVIAWLIRRRAPAAAQPGPGLAGTETSTLDT